MLNTFNDIESPQRQSFALGLSVVLHAMVLFLMLFNFSWADNDFEKSPPAILMVDLTKVQLADKTNLPPEVKKQKKQSYRYREQTGGCQRGGGWRYGQNK